VSGAAGLGFLNASSFGSDLSAMGFLVKMMNGGNFHAHLVTVQSVTNAGSVSPAGEVSVRILVNQIDRDGTSFPHGTIYAVPYFRLQGGANAIILDPVVGDIGIAVFADRDISSVKADKGQANPGSRRRFDPADALYIGGFLNKAPSQYVQFLPNGGGVNVVSPMEVTITAPTITANASTEFVVNSPLIALYGQIIGGTTGADAHALQGSISTTGDQLAGAGSANISQLAHQHVDAGGTGNSGPPATGT
jgi:hypothetical protein